MNILITGGSGFLSGVIGNSLEKTNNVFYGTRERKKLLDRNISKHMIREIDWDKRNTLSNALSNVDIVIHSAGLNSTVSKKYPKKNLHFHKVGTSDLIKLSKKKKVKKIIFFSTIHVYNSPLSGFLSEDSTPINNHPYAKGKSTAETLFLNERNNKSVEIIILRLSNIYGKPSSIDSVDWELLFNDICYQMIINKSVKLNSTGEQQINFFPINQLCRIVKFFVDEKKVNETIYNIGSPKSYKVKDFSKYVIERYEKLVGYKVPLITSKKFKEIRRFRLNVKRLQSLNIDIALNHQFEIDRSLNFFLNNLKV